MLELRDVGVSPSFTAWKAGLWI